MMRSSPNNRRARGRGNGGRRNGPSSSQHFDSSGPDLKVRGNASQIVEKYQALAREAATAGDPVMAENYYQHAEHYFRIMSAAAEARAEANRQDGDRSDRGSRGNGNGQHRPEENESSDESLIENGPANGNGAAADDNGPEQGASQEPVEDSAPQPNADETREPPEDSRNPADIAARASRPRRRRPRPEPELSAEQPEAGDIVN